MIKTASDRYFGLLVLLLSVIVLGFNCGKASKKADSTETLEPDQAKKAMITKHRAFDHFSKGDLYQRMGDLEKAADEYRLALFYDPESDELKRTLAGILFGLQRYDEALEINIKIDDPSVADLIGTADCYNATGSIDNAIEHYRKIAEMDSVPESIIRNLADFYSRLGDLSKTEYYYGKLIETSEENKFWRLQLASVYLINDKPDKAKKIYQDLVNEDSLNYSAFLGLANVYEYQDDISTADSLYTMVVEQNWDDAGILNMLLPAFMNINNNNMAVKITRRVIELYPDDYLSHRKYALLLFTIGDFDKSDSVLAAISELVDDDPIAYYYRGRIAVQTENYILAESLLVKSIGIEDSLYQSWIGLANARNSLSGYESALATIDTALVKCSADSVELFYYTGVFSSREERYPQAIEYFNRVLTAQPDDSDTKFNLAAAYERSKQIDNAEGIFLELLESEPDNPVVLNYLGYMYADNGIKLKEAKKLIKKALKINPNNGAYLDSYAWVMYKMGKYKEALEYQLRAIEASDTDAILYDHMGDIYFALDQKTEALDNWERALELNPDDEQIKAKMK